MASMPSSTGPSNRQQQQDTSPTTDSPRVPASPDQPVPTNDIFRPFWPSQMPPSVLQTLLSESVTFELTPIHVQLNPHPRLAELIAQIDEAIDAVQGTQTVPGSAWIAEYKLACEQRLRPFLRTASPEEWDIAIEHVNRRLAEQEWALHRVLRGILALDGPAPGDQRVAEVRALLDTLFTCFPDVQGRGPAGLLRFERGREGIRTGWMGCMVVSSLMAIRLKATWETQCRRFLCELQLRAQR